MGSRAAPGASSLSHLQTLAPRGREGCSQVESHSPARGPAANEHPSQVAMTSAPHLRRGRPRPPSRWPRPQHAPPAGTPPLQSRDDSALSALSDWFCGRRGWTSADSTAPQRGCSFQTSTVGSGPVSAAAAAARSHLTRGRVTVGGREAEEHRRGLPAELPEPRRVALRPSSRGRRRGADGRPSEGPPREDPPRPERSVSPPRAPASCRGSGCPGGGDPFPRASPPRSPGPRPRRGRSPEEGPGRVGGPVGGPEAPTPTQNPDPNPRPPADGGGS